MGIPIGVGIAPYQGPSSAGRHLHDTPATANLGPNDSVVLTAITKDICGGNARDCARRIVNSSTLTRAVNVFGPSQDLARRACVLASAVGRRRRSPLKSNAGTAS